MKKLTREQVLTLANKVVDQWERKYGKLPKIEIIPSINKQPIFLKGKYLIFKSNTTIH